MYAKTSKINYTPRKLRLVTTLVKGRKAEEALEILKNVNKKGSLVVYKTLKSAISNALNSKNVEPKSLCIESIVVDESMKLARVFRVSRGRGRQKIKRYSTLTVTLK